MENSAYMFAGVLCFYFGMAFIISSIIRNKPANKTRGQYHEELELTDRVYVGSYLGGLTAEEVQAPFVYCIITKDHFVFCRGRQGTEIGRVPRAAIRAVNLSKQSEKNHLLIIEWSAAAGANHSTQFQFIDKIAKQRSTDAADLLRRWSTASAAA